MKNKKHSPKKKNNVGGIIAVLLFTLLIIGALIFLLRPADKSADPGTGNELSGFDTGAPAQTEAPADTSVSVPDNSRLAVELGKDGNELEGLSESQLVQVDDLCVTEGLSEKWLNILLLGSDERIPGKNARTDAMMICSVNTETGEVKLTSILRDTAINFSDIGDFSGTYRINAANYFGGERLAMKTVNEHLEMNITAYVHVNFYGFQQIVQALGGVDIDVTQAEMEEINKRIVEQAKQAYDLGMTEDAENIPYQFLETYGENTHLDGRMALAYARIRHVDSDYSRTERQRTVLIKLLEKARTLGATEMLSLGTIAMPYLKTNLTLDQILKLALSISSKGFDPAQMETLRLPVNGSYVQETRNGQDMLYDTDWKLNTAELHGFIYN